MGFLDALLGRRTPRKPDLDALFGLPGAAVTLQTALGLHPSGTGAVCYRAAPGPAFQQIQDDIVALLQHDEDAPEVEVTTDGYGFTWLVVRDEPDDVGSLATDLHAVNTTLAGHGFADGLLCSMVPFREEGGGRTVGLVYLYKQGTFYPFAPAGEQQRDSLLEISVRDELSGELPVEEDRQRWLALWGAPGL